MITTSPLVSRSSYPLLAWGLLFLMALVWGSSFILIKFSLRAFTPAQVGAGRIAMAFLFFLPFLVRQARQPEMRLLFRQHWLLLLVSGGFGYLIPAQMFALAGAHLSSSLSGALNALSPLFTLALGSLFFGRPLVLRQAAGIALGVAGSVLLVFFSANGQFSVNAWALLVVLATVGYGLNTNVLGRYLSHLPALFIAVWSFALIGIPALLYLLTTDFPARAVRAENGLPLLALCALGSLGSGLMSVFFNRVVQLASPLFAASVTYLIPVVALGWGLLNTESIYLWQYIGMAVCLLGVYLINRK